MKHIRLMLIMFMLICGVVFGAGDNTYYVNSGGAGDGWGAGSDSYNETQAQLKATPWATLNQATDNHDSVDGDTVTIYIKKDGAISETRLLYNDAGSKHDGVNFIYSTDTPGDKWTLESDDGGDFFLTTSAITSGSITLRDCIVDSSNIDMLFYMDDGGMNIIIDDCSITQTRVNSRLIFDSSEDPAADDITISNTTTSCDGAALLNPTGAIFIGDGCSLTSTTDNVFDLGSDIESLYIGAATITAAGRGITTAGGKTLGNLSLSGTTIDAVDHGIIGNGPITNCMIQDCIISSDEQTAILLPAPIANLVMLGNEIDGPAASALAVLDASNYTISYNGMRGDNHVLNIAATNGNKGEVAYNRVAASVNVAMIFYCDAANIHHNSAYSSTGTCAVSAVGASGEPPASVDLKIHHNIFVSQDGVAFYDYDDSPGLDPNGREVIDAMNDYMDYNIYWTIDGSGTNVVKLGERGNEQECSTIAEVITAWKTATAGGGYWNVIFGDINDINSQIADPLLVDYVNFAVTPQSPAIGAGRDGSTIGAVPWQPRFRRHIRRGN